ncbi:MAG: hypothetical protein JJE35_05290 [Thermoleophilia bacterium]|nr:hypothetical protein [Thermoleophilia bacterium]
MSEGRPIRATSTQWMAVVGIEPSASNRATVSRSWSWLEEKRLISSHRQGRDRGIEILREDGTGQLWQPPGAHHEAYFGLPLAYWRGGYASELSLPAKSVLLIGLSLQSREEPFFQLPLRRGSDWYGLSASTLRRGLAELRRVGLLRRWAERRETEGSPLGHTYDQRYALNPLSDRGPLQLASQPADGSEDISF